MIRALLHTPCVGVYCYELYDDQLIYPDEIPAFHVNPKPMIDQVLQRFQSRLVFLFFDFFLLLIIKL